jgi:hypothetical protein
LGKDDDIRGCLADSRAKFTPSLEPEAKGYGNTPVGVLAQGTKNVMIMA